MTLSGKRKKYEPPVGNGQVGATLLDCGHKTHDGPVASIGWNRWYACPNGCVGLQKPARRRERRAA